MKKTITFANMSCNHCVQVITKALETLDSVRVISADTTTKTVTIDTQTDYSLKDLQNSLIDTVYQATNVQ